MYLGGNLHISQGLEVSAWDISAALDYKTLMVRLERPGQVQGDMDLFLPAPPLQVLLNNLPLPFTELTSGCYRFSLDFDRTADILIQYPSTG
jgi:hypothetical protein